MTSSTSRRSLHILKRFTFLESLEQMLVLGDESGVCELESFFGRSLHEVKGPRPKHRNNASLEERKAKTKD